MWKSDLMTHNSLKIGIDLEILFFVLFFGAILPKINNVLGAITCFVIGLISLFICI